ncbi:MAG: hypothetical protein CM1200mP2_10520 [Planctomycetaceae bacterium]|nr:MAG: hypothetical protein CM1200mP2_10520 [Planctomycetaceae bacterium]
MMQRVDPKQVQAMIDDSREAPPMGDAEPEETPEQAPATLRRQ